MAGHLCGFLIFLTQLRIVLLTILSNMQRAGIACAAQAQDAIRLGLLQPACLQKDMAQECGCLIRLADLLLGMLGTSVPQAEGFVSATEGHQLLIPRGS